MSQPRSPHRFYSFNRAIGRGLFGAVVGAIVFAVVVQAKDLGTAIISAWDATALALIVAGWWVISSATVEHTKRRAAAEDPGRNALGALVVISSAVSVFSSALLLRSARASVGDGPLLMALTVGAVVLSWILTHTVYTLRYAHLYYREDDEGGEGGLDFPGDDAPADIDFAYFAFTVGMCFQVSDIAISSSGIRRVALFHSILSFAYNTVIIAFTLNLMAGFLH